MCRRFLEIFSSPYDSLEFKKSELITLPENTVLKGHFSLLAFFKGSVLKGWSEDSGPGIRIPWRQFRDYNKVSGSYR